MLNTVKKHNGFGCVKDNPQISQKQIFRFCSLSRINKLANTNYNDTTCLSNFL
jgi:hypothetical protein